MLQKRPEDIEVSVTKGSKWDGEPEEEEIVWRLKPHGGRNQEPEKVTDVKTFYTRVPKTPVENWLWKH